MKIFSKLFLLLLGISVIPLAVIGGSVLWRSGALRNELLDENAQTGDLTTRTSQQALYQQARRGYQQLVEAKARDLEDFFENGRSAVQLQSTLLSSYLGEPPSGGDSKLYSSDEMAALMRDPDFRAHRLGHEPYAVYHLAPGVPEEAVRDSLARLARLGTYFAFHQQSSPWIKSTYFGSAEGFILGYPGSKPFPADYDPRKRDWYRKASAKGRVTWTELYVDKDGLPVMTCAEPVFARGKLIGVSAVDVALKEFLDRVFDVGTLAASDAVLVNYLGQVRFSARYQPGGQVTIESRPPELSPLVATFLAGRFTPSFNIVSRGKSGVLATGKDGSVVSSVEASEGGDLYAYAPVTIRTREGGKQWYYIVRTPMSEIIGPVLEIRKRLGIVNGILSQFISTDLREMGAQIWIVLSLVALCALGLAYFSAGSVTGPLLAINEAVRKIGRGNLDQRVELARGDEIGELGAAINEMAKGLKEGLFVKTTFKRYVAASVVDQLIKNPEKLKLGGERKELTVFFSDISGFSSLSERLTPERLVELINDYLSEMTDAIFAHEGTLDKYEGDAIVAFWGAPIDQTDHALRACKAALGNIDALHRLWKKWDAEGVPRLDMRIGLNTGPMVVGNMGSPIKMEYTVMGDAVNLGSRLEGANKPYGTHILISEATRRAAGSAIVARELDLLAVKGKSAVVKVYELIGLSGRVPAKTLEGLHAFEVGLDACRRRFWDEALNAFHLADRLLEGDKPSRVFIERVERFSTAPPPADWDGRFVLTEK